MEEEQQQEVVIVGAGIAGLATALALKRVGIKSVVLERASELRATGAAITLFSNGWRALDALGVAHKLAPLYPPYETGLVTNLVSGAVQEFSYTGTTKRMDTSENVDRPPSSSGANVGSSPPQVEAQKITEESSVPTSSSGRPKMRVKRTAKRRRSPIFEDDDFVVTLNRNENLQVEPVRRSPRTKKVLFSDDTVVVEKKLTIDEGKSKKRLKKKQTEVELKGNVEGGSDSRLQKSKGKKPAVVEEEEEDEEGEDILKIRTRMSPHALKKFLSSLTELQKNDVRTIGFGGFLGLSTDELPMRLPRWLLDHFDPIVCSIVVGGKSLALTDDDVHVIFGLPKSGRVVEEETNRNCKLYRALVCDWKSQWENVGDVTVKMLVDKMKEQVGGGDEFKRNFVVFVVSTMISGSQNIYCNYRVLKSLVDVNEILRMNWCIYTLQSLVSSVLQWKKSGISAFFKGPIFFLVICYLDRFVFKTRLIPREFPIISSWTRERISARLKDELNHGGFGQGRVETVANADEIRRADLDVNQEGVAGGADVHVAFGADEGVAGGLDRDGDGGGGYYGGDRRDGDGAAQGGVDVEQEFKSDDDLLMKKKSSIERMATAARQFSASYCEFIASVKDASVYNPDDAKVGRMSTLATTMMSMSVNTDVAEKCSTQGSEQGTSQAYTEELFSMPGFFDSIDELAKDFYEKKSKPDEEMPCFSLGLTQSPVVAAATIHIDESGSKTTTTSAQVVEDAAFCENLESTPPLCVSEHDVDDEKETDVQFSELEGNVNPDQVVGDIVEAEDDDVAVLSIVEKIAAAHQVVGTSSGVVGDVSDDIAVGSEDYEFVAQKDGNVDIDVDKVDEEAEEGQNKRPRRATVPSLVYRSPFWLRNSSSLKSLTKLEKMLSNWAFSELASDSEGSYVVYDDGEHTLRRSVLQDFSVQNKNQTVMVNFWCDFLNYCERFSYSVKRFFVYVTDEEKCLASQYPDFEKLMDDQCAVTKQAGILTADLIFLPILSSSLPGYFYVICFNMKNKTLELLDIMDTEVTQIQYVDIVSRLAIFLSSYIDDKKKSSSEFDWMSGCKINILSLKWKVKKLITVDTAIFTMKHMQSYHGSMKDMDVGFKSYTALLSDRLRAKIVAEIIDANQKKMKDEVHAKAIQLSKKEIDSEV